MTHWCSVTVLVLICTFIDYRNCESMANTRIAESSPGFLENYASGDNATVDAVKDHHRPTLPSVITGPTNPGPVTMTHSESMQRRHYRTAFDDQNGGSGRNRYDSNEEDGDDDDDDYSDEEWASKSSRKPPGVSGPAHTYIKTDKNANFKWGVRHFAGKQYGG
ncbi:uncharacterized protein LOC131434260 [Malaya genurostris]|uniref:uncharacterized protein LOC131434260 n=1 Tax=Malaya genurostris TaxID=325434 RepID=UPI0026F399AA|nr:uncharacterized protein LOC131434260 [Malaya genurostris]